MRFALRFDAVQSVNKDFAALIDLLIEKKIAATYAVIPSLIDHQSTSLLSEKARSHPRLVSIVPYGWSGSNYGSGARPGEFGEFRSRAQQWEDIKRSIERMDRLFMHRWSRVFVLPFNNYDHITQEILKSNMFMAFSARCSPYQKHLLPDVGASIVLGKPTLAKSIVSECQFLLNAREGIVIAIRPEALAGVYVEEIKKAALVLVARNARPVILSELAGVSLEKVI